MNLEFRIKNLKSIIGERGQAALIVILALLSVSAVLVMSVGALTFNEIKKLNNIVKSAQSYYVAEAGVEDALLRAQNRALPGGCPPCSYTLDLGLPGSAGVDVTGTTDQPVITSKGDVDKRIRKVKVGLMATSSSTGIAFNYGIQVGYGGLTLLNSTVNGNVYSNGPILGQHNDSSIIGTAISANSAALTADQVNDSPASPPNGIEFRRIAGNQDAAQSFQLSSTGPINKLSLNLKKTGSPGNFDIRVTNDTSGNPGTTVYASGTLTAGSVTGSYGWVDVPLSPNPQLTSGITYWIVLDPSTNNNSNYFTWGANSDTSYSSGQAKSGVFSSGPWSAPGLDGYFKVYFGGVTGLIQGNGSGGSQRMDISVDAKAHTVNNSNVTGNLYCQTGSGNNKSCPAPPPSDPVAQSFPISDANITNWKAEAEAGGVIGSQNISGSQSLGPVKINGDLTFTNNATLTLTGTVWVAGTITTANNVTIKLDPGYGSNGGIMLSDGYIYLSNGTNFLGSGIAGSYFLLISTNDCDGTTATSPTGLSCVNNSAIEVNNNVGTVIIYGSRGEVHLNNTAGAKEITGYKLRLDNNASVTYETGLASVEFSSGPGGGYDILSWEEIE